MNGQSSLEPPHCDDPPSGTDSSITHNGTVASWGNLDQWRPYLLRIAIDELDSQLRPKVAPSDLVQQTLLQAHRSRRDFRGTDAETFRRWLRQILVHQLADANDRYHGTAKRRLSAEVCLDADSKQLLRDSLADRAPSPAQRVATQERVTHLQAAVSQLPVDYRQVIELRNRQQLGFAEIGKILNRSADAARLLWYRALKALAQMMQDEPRN